MAIAVLQRSDCGHTFGLAYGAGTTGASMTCLNCGGKNVHRAEEDRGYNRGGRGAGRGRGPASAGRGRTRA